MNPDSQAEVVVATTNKRKITFCNSDTISSCSTHAQGINQMHPLARAIDREIDRAIIVSVLSHWRSCLLCYFRPPGHCLYQPITRTLLCPDKGIKSAHWQDGCLPLTFFSSLPSPIPSFLSSFYLKFLIIFLCSLSCLVLHIIVSDTLSLVHLRSPLLVLVVLCVCLSATVGCKLMCRPQLRLINCIGRNGLCHTCGPPVQRGICRG
jgi:hypothetical protein